MISFGTKYGAGIKSVQRGLAAGAGLEITIAAVNPAKTFVLACWANSTTLTQYMFVGAHLTGPTKIQIWGSGPLDWQMSWQVVEFY